jgi:hypothetical protein
MGPEYTDFEMNDKNLEKQVALIRKADELSGRFFAVPEDPVMVVERTACGCYLERHTFQTSKANPATYPAAA